MSPEQACGDEVDARSDIWSFGCVLYEALTGRRAFSGESRADTLLAVLGQDPDWTALPEETPETVRALLRRCLQRDRTRRLHHIADARIELEDPFRRPRTRRWRQQAIMALIATAAAAGLGLAVRSWTGARSARRWPLPRLHIALPRPLQPSDLRSGQTTLAFSPDGRRLVFAAGHSGSRRLYSRPLDELDVLPIKGTGQADNPFFSPDGQWIGYSGEGKLKKIPVAGGEPVELCDIPGLRGASWSTDGTIIFSPSAFSDLLRVSETGGLPRPITVRRQGEISHRWPQVLPGGRSVLFSVMTENGNEDERTVDVVSLETGERHTLLRGATYPRYLATGHLLFGRARALYVAPMDLGRLKLTGPPVRVLEDVLIDTSASGVGYFDVASDGTLVYAPVRPYFESGTLRRFDRQGRFVPLGEPPGSPLEPALSPDGRRLAVTIEGRTTDIWIYELARDNWTRLTFAGNNGSPVWSADGTQIVFTSTREGPRNIYRIRADGGGDVERLTHSKNWQNILSYAPDGSTVFFTEQATDTLSDIWSLALQGSRPLQRLLATSAAELFPALSPDGRWLAYTSDESGREEVYVRSYPGLGRKWLISTTGGSEPIWTRRGRELFYRSGNDMMSVAINTQSDFVANPPRHLFSVPFDVSGSYANYTASADGDTFVIATGNDQTTGPPPIVVVLGWFEELRAKLR
jgi:serine/threonine-protein kinase